MCTNIIDEDENYTIEIMQEHHLPDCAALLTDSFTKQNPLCLYLHTTYDQFYPLTLSQSESILKDRVSLVAIHKLTKELHACILNSDAKTLEVHHPIFPTENAADLDVFEPVVDLLQELEERYFLEYAKINGKELKERCLMKILFGATRVGCEGHGLGTKLRRHALEYARQRGFKHAIVELSNPITHHIYTKKLGGREFTSIYAPTWIWKKKNNNSLPFEHFMQEMTLIVIDL